MYIKLLTSQTARLFTTTLKHELRPLGRPTSFSSDALQTIKLPRRASSVSHTRIQCNLSMEYHDSVILNVYSYNNNTTTIAFPRHTPPERENDADAI